MVEKTAEVMVGESIDLSCIVGPEDATDKTIITPTPDLEKFY